MWRQRCGGHADMVPTCIAAELDLSQGVCTGPAEETAVLHIEPYRVNKLRNAPSGWCVNATEIMNP